MATWTYGTAGRVTGEDWVHAKDFEEICAAVNRRRLLVYQFEDDFAGGDEFDANTWIKFGPISSQTTPWYNLRGQITGTVLNPTTGGLGGEPPTPSYMKWLWPVAGADEDKIIVTSTPGVGEVNFFAKMNGTASWTDSTLNAQTWTKAVHLNELRWSAEHITRGRWEWPVYYSAGIISTAPDTPWAGEWIANNGTDELRSLGWVNIATLEDPNRGLRNVAVRDSSRIYLTADMDCQVAIYHCLRELKFGDDPPTWNKYQPLAGKSWSSPGGLGGGDSTYIGGLTLTADEEGYITGSAVASALQAMVEGAEQCLLVRRTDTDYYTVSIEGRVRAEFDVDVPPN